MSKIRLNIKINSINLKGRYSYLMEDYLHEAYLKQFERTWGDKNKIENFLKHQLGIIFKEYPEQIEEFNKNKTVYFDKVLFLYCFNGTSDLKYILELGVIKIKLKNL